MFGDIAGRCSGGDGGERGRVMLFLPQIERYREDVLRIQEEYYRRRHELNVWHEMALTRLFFRLEEGAE